MWGDLGKEILIFQYTFFKSKKNYIPIRKYINISVGFKYEESRTFFAKKCILEN